MLARAAGVSKDSIFREMDTMPVKLTPWLLGQYRFAFFNELREGLKDHGLGRLEGIAKLFVSRQREAYTIAADTMQAALRDIGDEDAYRRKLLFVALAFQHLRLFVLDPVTQGVYEIEPEAWNFWADEFTREAVATGAFPDPGELLGFDALDRRFKGFPLLILRAEMKDWLKDPERDWSELERYARTLMARHGRIRKAKLYELMLERYRDLTPGQCRKVWNAVRTCEMSAPGRPTKEELRQQIDPRSEPDKFFFGPR